MARRWTNVVLVLLVLVNLGLLVAVVKRHQDDSGRAHRSAPATTQGVGTGASPSPARSSSGASPRATSSPSAGHSRSPRPTPSPSHAAATQPSAGRGHVVLDDTSPVGAAFRPVAIRGQWQSASSRIRRTVRVEVRQRGSWSAFPLPAAVERSGRFTAYAALGPRGRYRVRVVGSGGGPASAPVIVTVR